MAGARDVARATRRIREEQKKRNAAAIAEAQERLTKLEEEAARIRPSARRRLADREAGVHRVKQGDPPENKMEDPGANKGEVVLRFDSETSRALAERYLAANEQGGEKHQAFIDLLAKTTPSAAEGFTEEDVNDAIEEIETSSAEKSLEDVVSFASSSARDLAVVADLSPADFEGREPSGKTGFTVADVEGLIDEIEDVDDEEEDEEEEDE